MRAAVTSGAPRPGDLQRKDGRSLAGREADNRPNHRGKVLSRSLRWTSLIWKPSAAIASRPMWSCIALVQALILIAMSIATAQPISLLVSQARDSFLPVAPAFIRSATEVPSPKTVQPNPLLKTHRFCARPRKSSSTTMALSCAWQAFTARADRFYYAV